MVGFLHKIIYISLYIFFLQIGLIMIGSLSQNTPLLFTRVMPIGTALLGAGTGYCMAKYLSPYSLDDESTKLLKAVLLVGIAGTAAYFGGPVAIISLLASFIFHSFQKNDDGASNNIQAQLDSEIEARQQEVEARKQVEAERDRLVGELENTRRLHQEQLKSEKLKIELCETALKDASRQEQAIASKREAVLGALDQKVERLIADLKIANDKLIEMQKEKFAIEADLTNVKFDLADTKGALSGVTRALDRTRSDLKQARDDRDEVTSKYKSEFADLRQKSQENESRLQEKLRVSNERVDVLSSEKAVLKSKYTRLDSRINRLQESLESIGGDLKIANEQFVSAKDSLEIVCRGVDKIKDEAAKASPELENNLELRLRLLLEKFELVSNQLKSINEQATRIGRIAISFVQHHKIKELAEEES